MDIQGGWEMEPDAESLRNAEPVLQRTILPPNRLTFWHILRDAPRTDASIPVWDRVESTGQVQTVVQIPD